LAGRSGRLPGAADRVRAAGAAAGAGAAGPRGGGPRRARLWRRPPTRIDPRNLAAAARGPV